MEVRLSPIELIILKEGDLNKPPVKKIQKLLKKKFRREYSLPQVWGHIIQLKRKVAQTLASAT